MQYCNINCNNAINALIPVGDLTKLRSQDCQNVFRVPPIHCVALKEVNLVQFPCTLVFSKKIVYNWSEREVVFYSKP